MTDNNHPITPSPELVQKWDNDWHRSKIKYDTLSTFVATQAARWGADQELEACCDWTAIVGGAEALRAARRPKPPSLKEQALELVDRLEKAESPWVVMSELATIRRALEQLDD